MWTFDKEIERNQDLSDKWIVRVQMVDERGKTEGRHLFFAESPSAGTVSGIAAEVAVQMNAEIAATLPPEPQYEITNEDGSVTVI